MDLVEGGALGRPLAGELLCVVWGLVGELAGGVVGEAAGLLRRRRRGRAMLLLDAGEGAGSFLTRVKEAGVPGSFFTWALDTWAPTPSSGGGDGWTPMVATR
jgi:hypothetical protein